MIKLYDRIKELSYVIGTGNITLSGATRGFSTFSSCYSNGDALFYGITDGTVYELGSGLYVSSSNQIQRFPVKSTNNNSLVNFTEGTKEVYVNYPATNSVFNTSGINPVPQSSGLAFWTSSNSLSYNDNLIFNSGNSRLGLNKSSPSVALDIGGSLAYSQLRVSGISVSESGIYFPSGNNGLSSYSGGRQLVHFQPNQLSSQLSQVLQLSGIVNQNIVLKKQNSNMVFAGPSGYCNPPCGPDYPSFRLLNKYDIPQEIPNLDVGNDDSSVTFLRIFLPNGLPDNVYRDINAIEVNSNSNVFAVNGLGHIEIGTIGYSQVLDLDDTMNSVSGVSGIIYSVSGALNSRITAVSGVINSASGALNSRITSVSGYLDNRISNINNFISNPNNNLWNARLSLSSTDSTYSGSGTSLYLTQHLGNAISLYNGSSWQTMQFNSKLVSNFSSLSPNTIYDVFGYLNNNDISFELTPWSMYTPYDPETPEIEPVNSSRTINLSTVDGVYCKSGNNTRRYIGTIRTSSSGFLDNESDRLICNFYNKIKKIIRSDVNSINNDPYFTFSWIYPTNVIRQIPYISEVSVVNGLNSNIDLKVILEILIPYVRSEYTLGIIRKPEINNILESIDNDATFDYYAAIVLSGTNGLVTTENIGGDYQDGLQKTISASIYCQPVGYEKYHAIEKSRLGSPVVYGNRVVGSYGIMGTYEC
jgi:hypothetical protein